MFLRTILMLVILGFPSITSALNNGNNGYLTPEIDVRAYGVKCDNTTTTDNVTLTAAISTLNAAGGGVLIFPANQTCLLSADVTLLSRVSLRGLPGAKIKADTSGTFTDGLLVGSSISSVRIEGLTFDLNGKNKPAIKTSGEDISIVRNYVYNGDTSEASDWNLIDWGCGTNGSSPASSHCEFSGNRIECASTSGANDVGLNTTGSTDDGQKQFIANNQVIGCDSYGIKSAAIATIVHNGVTATDFGISSSATESTIGSNRIKITGNSGIGINISGTRTGVIENKIAATGTSGVGIKITAAFDEAIGNKISIAGPTGIAIYTTGAKNVINGNSYTLTSNDAGTDSTVGIYVGDGNQLIWGWSITGNSGVVSTTDSQTHLLIAGAQIVATGNYFEGGKYCTAPSQASYTENVGAFNVTFSNNRCFAQHGTAVIAKTGYLVEGNYLAWLNTSGTALIEAGDGRTYPGITSHLSVIGNILHVVSGSTASGILVQAPGKLCNAGSLQGQACTIDANCTGGGAGSCAAAVGGGHVVVTGNHFLMSVADHGPMINLDDGFTSASADFTDMIIAGNIFNAHTAQNDSIATIKCDASLSSKLSNIVVGTNSYTGYAPVLGDDTDGKIDLNCTPSVVKDSDTSFIWLPAGGCNGSTAYPLWDLGSSSAPTPFCNGSNQPRGFLGFPDGSTTEAFVAFSIPNTSTYQFFVRPIYSVNASNNLNTRWSFTARCSGNDDAGDSSWTESEVTYDTLLGSVAAMDLRNTGSYSTIGAFACAKDIVTLRVRRLGANGSDDQTNTSYLYGLQVWARKQT